MRQMVHLTEMVVMQDSIMKLLVWFNDQCPFVGVLAILSGIDVLTGLIAAGKKGGISSKISWNGTAKKVGLFLAVAVGNILEPFSGIPLGRMTAMFYIVTESISITENLDRAGIPVPKFLKDFLVKLKTADAEKTPGVVVVQTETHTTPQPEQAVAPKEPTPPADK